MNDVSIEPRRWFCAIPMTYSEAGRFWVRDTGLVCLGFRTLGIDSRFVALGEPCIHEDMPLITGTLGQMQDAAWWKQWQVGVLLLCTWALPQFEPIAKAVKDAGIKLFLIMDSDGFVSPHVSPWISFQHKCVREMDDHKSWFPRGRALIKAVVSSFKLRHKKTIRHLEHADLVVLPSPLAKQRYRRFLLAMGRPDLAARLKYVPYAVTSDMVYDGRIAKRPLIIAVGRWHTEQKNAPLLARVVQRVLQEQPEYSVRILGDDGELVRNFLLPRNNEYAARVEILGNLEHKKLPPLYQESQIILCTSYMESFHIAAAEALCCGCSVVANGRISSMPYFVQFGSGAISCDLSLSGFTDALFAEIDCWKTGDRDPLQISKTWTAKLHPQEVARSFVRLASP